MAAWQQAAAAKQGALVGRPDDQNRMWTRRRERDGRHGGSKSLGAAVGGHSGHTGAAIEGHKGPTGHKGGAFVFPGPPYQAGPIGAGPPRAASASAADNNDIFARAS
ncbi:unnamed protein product, partial [Amoebophrya sp. A25]|eukprot:GSA25T00003288001.1